MGIRRRMVVSFLALFGLVMAVTALLSTYLVAGAVERRMAAQVENLARLIEGIEPPTLRNYLPRLLDLCGAKSIRVGALRVPEGIPSPFPGGRAFRVSTRHGELEVAFGAGEISRERAAALRPFLLVALAGMVLFAVLGILTAQAIARPLERLASQARALPGGGGVRPVGGGAELDHLVEALNRMLEEVRRTERLGVMGRMAAGVAHEIRNPLASMKMTIQMLRSEARDPEPYDRLLQEIERLDLATAELTGISRPLRRERVRLERVVDDVLALLSRQLEHLSVRVERRYAPVPEVEVDVARFKRCVMNLVLNGAQAMPGGGPLVVELAPRDGRVRLSVTDAGAGVPEAIRDRIFEPFVTTREGGVGLGLALTRQAVEDHGGRIGFDSVPGKTTFWIEI